MAKRADIIIVGAGEIGRHLAASLSREAHSISVIESDPQLAAELEQSGAGSIDAAEQCYLRPSSDSGKAGQSGYS